MSKKRKKKIKKQKKKIEKKPVIHKKPKQSDFYTKITDFYNSNFNNITGNKISNNNNNGIVMDTFCTPEGPFPPVCYGNTNNTLQGNEISNNGIGIQSESSNSKIFSNIVCGNTNQDFNSSDWQSSYGEKNACETGDWDDPGITGCWYTCSGLPRICDINRDGIVYRDYNDLMAAYKCFLGIGNCDKINYGDWNNLRYEYLCFVNNYQF